jgi:glycosyltransferase involved in cell wall biosynthesis
VRRAVVSADNAYLAEAQRIYTNSRVTSHRLQRFNGFESNVLYPPLVDANGFRSGVYGDYVFYPSRINPIKRQLLAVQAMEHVRTDVRLVVAGAPDEPWMLEELAEHAVRLGLGDRVSVLGRWIGHKEKADLMADALACAYLPVDEDSYGFVSLEAYEAARPVVTCTDSGGTLDVVCDGVTGIVVPPRPEALAAAFDGLFADRERARRLGEAGARAISALELSWDRVVAELTR